MNALLAQGRLVAERRVAPARIVPAFDRGEEMVGGIKPLLRPRPPERRPAAAPAHPTYRSHSRRGKASCVGNGSRATRRWELQNPSEQIPATAGSND